MKLMTQPMEPTQHTEQQNRLLNEIQSTKFTV